MNRQFTQMGGKLAKKLETTNVNFKTYLKSPSKNSFFIRKATESEVSKLFHEINTNKMFGIDEIPPKVLKWGEALFIPTNTHQII